MTGFINVRVTPRSSKPGIGGWRAGPDGREELEVRIAAAPAEGAANDALIRLLAGALGVPKSRLSIAAGQTSRHKRIAVPMTADQARRRLAATDL